jgi:hypothetical protein
VVLKILEIRESEGERKLSDLMWIFGRNECSDPRDRVFGLLSLSNDGISLTPDYTSSTREVFVEATKTLLHTCTLEILRACGDRGPYSKLLPSWVPDWVPDWVPYPTTMRTVPVT